MRNQLTLLIAASCVLQLACGRPGEAPEGYGFKPPRVVEAKTLIVPPEQTEPPKVISLSGIKKRVAGKPGTVQLTSTVFTAMATRILPAGAPGLFLPNGERFRLPATVPAIDSPFIAGQPEVSLLKEPFVKENNPESFSSIKALHGLKTIENSPYVQRF